MVRPLGVDLRNDESYPDPTAYEALKNLQRAEYGYRPLAYICSPFSGDVEANVTAAQRFCAFAVEQGFIPFAPHLLYPQFMDDTDVDERDLAMFFNRIMLTKSDQLWVLLPTVSSGMKTEMGWADHLEIPIRFFTRSFEEVRP